MMDVAAADLWSLAAVVLLGVALRLPLSIVLLMRMIEGLPPGDMASVQDDIHRMRHQKWPNDYRVRESPIPGSFGYPAFFHWLVSRFPQRLWRPASVALNLSADVVMAIAVYFLVRWKVGALVGADAARAREWACLATTLFVTAPLLMPVTARLGATNGRCFGNLLGQIGLLGMWASATTHPVAGFVVAVVFTLLASLTSLFSTQVLVFFSPVLALLYLDPAPVLAVATAMVLGWRIPSLGVREIIELKIRHLFWYRVNKSNPSMSIAGQRSLFAAAFAGLLALRGGVAAAKPWLTDRAPLLILAYSAPVIFPAAIVLTASDVFDVLWRDPVMRFCLTVQIPAFLCFVATSTPAFTDWGQAERYVEYTIGPLTAVAAVAMALAGWSTATITALVAVQLSALLFLHLYTRAPVLTLNRRFPHEHEEREIVAAIAADAARPVIQSVPQQLGRYWNRLFEQNGCPARIVTGWLQEPGRPLGEGFRTMNEIFPDQLQVPSPSPAEMRDRYGLTHIVAQRRFLDMTASLPFVLAMRADCRKLIETERYAVYAVDPPLSASPPADVLPEEPT